MRVGKSKCKYFLVVAGLLAFAASSGGSEKNSPDIHVELADASTLSLKVTLRSRSETPVTLYKNLLPWGNVGSLLLTAITPDGQCVQRNVPIDDPGLEKVTLTSNQWVSGTIDLRFYFMGLDTVAKKSDVHLFWAYQAPPELKIATWSGGWVMIPQQK